MCQRRYARQAGVLAPQRVVLLPQRAILGLSPETRLTLGLPRGEVLNALACALLGVRGLDLGPLTETLKFGGRVL